MPKRDQAFMQQQRERILDAAYHCFERKGFRDTSIRNICHEAKLSIGAVYVHFENRDEIVAAVCKRITSATTTRTAMDCSVVEFVDYLAKLLIDCNSSPSITELNQQLVADAFFNEDIAETYRELMGINSDWLREHVEQFRDAGEIEMPYDLDTTVHGLAAYLAGLSLRMNFQSPQCHQSTVDQMQFIVAQLIGIPLESVSQTDLQLKAV